MSKQGLILDKVVLLGRTFEEYVRYFALDPAALRGRAVLDVASGVSSFCAEANAQGINVTAFDLIYQFALEEIQSRCEPDLDRVAKTIGQARTYKWDFYQSPEGMRAYRERAYKAFLEDYRKHGGTRYISGNLPLLPFADRQFDVTLTSYLLFVYEDHFDYEFHKRSIIEIMRVTKDEARCYPVVTFEARRCSYIDRLKADADLAQFTFEQVKTDFEFLIGSNSFLRIRHQQPHLPLSR